MPPPILLVSSGSAQWSGSQPSAREQRRKCRPQRLDARRVVGNRLP